MTIRQCFASGGFLVLLLSGPHLGLTQSGGDDLQQRYEMLQQEIEALKAGQKAIIKELQELKKSLAARTGDRSPVRDINVMLNITEGFAMGDKHAMLTLVEFTDYQ